MQEKVVVMISCSKCGWESTATNECDAEADFTDHVQDKHMAKGKITEAQKRIAYDNINITQNNHDVEYFAIYVAGSLLSPHHLGLARDDKEARARCDASLTSLDMATELARDIAKVSRLSIHYTKGLYSKREYVAEIK